MLGRAAGGTVDPDDIAWEPSPGFLAETFSGRRVLFLARAEEGGPRDLYRAHVRVTLGGQPIDVTRIRNVTDTALGDDAALEISGRSAVFATVAFGRIQGVTVLDVEGVPRGDRPSGLFDRLMLGISSFQQTGTWAGLGRTDVVLDLPAQRARLTLEGDGTGAAAKTLSIDLGDPGRNLVYDVAARTVRSAEGGQAYAARAAPQVHHPKPFIHWAVDTVREEVGPGPIAWLEDKVFGARDTVKRTTFAIFASESERALKSEATGEAPAAVVLDASKLQKDAVSWPPPKIPSLWQEVKPGEGEWEPVQMPWLESPPGVITDGKEKPQPYFYRTFIRPDVERPYATLLLIAMDMRQLELGMEAGFEDPKPLTGPPGSGRLPRDRNLLDRVVGTFNGAFKTTHGKYGMMVRKRVLIPPVKGGATVMVTDGGRVGLGSWPQTEDIPEEIVSFRQNLDPLVEDGSANPTGRYIWGWQLSGTSIMTERTALCVTPAGHLYYAWGKEIDGPTLGKALRQAGCSYGIHLDMNPKHCGFVFTDIVDLRAKEFHLKKADPGMGIAPDKFVRWSPKDFFYVMIRDLRPRDGAASVRWEADGGVQPRPAWLPGIFKGKLSIGSLEISLMSFEQGRVDWRMRAGTSEPSVLDAPPKKLELDGDDKFRVLAAIGVGHTTKATSYGLAFDSLESLPLRSSYATLTTSPGKGMVLAPPGKNTRLPQDGEGTQLPLLADEGNLVAGAREQGAMLRRGALCVTSSGRVLLAYARHDSYDPIATALLRLGCKRVVALDRGSRHPAFVHRAGSATPPIGGYETTVLYALGRRMLPHAFRWKAKGATRSTKPTGFDHPGPKKKKID